MCFGVACMSKCVSSTENALYSFLTEEYVQKPHFKEIQCCRVKTTRNVLEILNLDKKKIPHCAKLACFSYTTHCNSMYFGVACMSKPVSSLVKALYIILRRICANTSF